VHYDLRLEDNGVFKSWAVTKGPSLNPADKRLAVEVEDHPLDYGDFEGTIPKGEYGGGTVMLWDRGFWMPEGTNDINAALRKGELKFTLAGQKLQGSFALVRMKRDRDGGKRNNWLLIKHRDEFASDKDVAKHDKSVASGRTMEQIAAGKGRGPKPFMAAGSKASAPTAIWHSNRARDTKASRASVKLLAATSARKTSARSSGEREATGKAGTTVIMGVTISHPDKALWPAEKKDGPVTKRDLAIYLQTAGAWMIEHLKGRPCSIIRAPDGINAQKFFQRHAMPGVSDLVELTTVEGDRKPTPSKDTWRSLSHLSALRLSRAKGVIDSPAFLPMPSKRASSAARRTPNDSGNSDCRAFRRRQSNAMKIAGVSLDRRTMRLCAGCRRICSASKESTPSTGMTNSPSSTKVFAETARRFSSTSGKKRDSDLPDLALISASPPARNARHRNPSHLGSNCQPDSLGSSVTSFASMGARSSGIPSPANPDRRVLAAVTA
jgi:DNA ligase D-like protein (predicted 3'-phosphoesterase)